MQKIVKNLLIVLILINFIYVLSGVTNFPLISIDVISIWLYKAKYFYYSNGSIIESLRSITHGHTQYPVLLPFLFYKLFQLLGNFNELYVLILYPFLYLICLYLCYINLIKLGITKTKSLFLTYFYSMFPALLAMGGRAHSGEADIFIIIALWLVIYLDRLFFENGSSKILNYITITVILAASIKTEGIFLASTILFLPLRLRKKMIYIILSSIPTLSWMAIVKTLHITADFGYILPNIQELIVRDFTIFYLTVKEMFKINNWYLFWPVFFLSLTIKAKNDRFVSRVVTPSLLIILLGYYLNYVFSSIEPAEYVPSSVDRVLMQTSPLFYTIFIYKLKLIIDKIA